MKEQVYLLPNEKATINFSTTLAVACLKPCLIYFYGDLGVGKTTFCRGFLNALGHNGDVKSPTYTLIESYILPNFIVYHFDLYRLVCPDELEFIGIRDYFYNKSFCLVEWPQHGGDILPPADINVTLYYLNNEGRKVQIQACSSIGMCVLTQANFILETNLWC